ncbi:MAG: imidazole glycerol phosphate synthase subunit HisH, partial [Chloroflexota bacterium]
MKIVVIDYQSGNLRSVAKALEFAGVRPLVTGDPAQLETADAVVLPGVGSGPAAMAALRERGLVEPLREYVASGRPFLGVCLGLQLLLDRTEEGDARCLGIIPGQVRRLPAGLKVPHMG